MHRPDEVACYVIDRLEFHRCGMGLSNVRTRRGNEAAGTEKDMDKCPKGQRVHTEHVQVTQNKNIKSFKTIKKMTATLLKRFMCMLQIYLR